MCLCLCVCVLPLKIIVYNSSLLYIFLYILFLREFCLMEVCVTERTVNLDLEQGTWTWFVLLVT